MMPFSVLRMWSLGIISWAILGLGIYSIYYWWKQEPRPTATRVVATSSRRDEDGSREESRLISAHRPSRDPVPLAIGVTLILLSGCGGLPVIWILRRFSAEGPKAFHSTQVQHIDQRDGSRLYVEHHGIATGPTLVFTHGWSLNRTVWYYTKQALKDRFHLVLWDLAGLGRSRAPRNHDHSLEKMASDLQTVIEKSTDGPVILVGHSIGGMIIQTFCRLYPTHLKHRVIGLALVHTSYTNPVKTTMLGKALVAIQKPILEPLNYLTLWLSPLVWLSNWQSYLNGSLHLSTRLTSFAGTQTWNQIDYSSRLLAMASPAVLARGNFAMTAFDAKATLPEISVPTLVVAATNDRLTCDEASEIIANSIPNANLIQLSPAGHLGLWERHTEFNEALIRFCDGLTSEPRPSLARTPQPATRAV